MNILEQIAAQKVTEVAELQSLYPTKLLEKSIYFATQTVSLRKYLMRPDKSGIIAEFKRKSPSKGMINKYAPVERTTVGYMQAGASALSVLTDSQYFGGSSEDLTLARKFNFCPILRKDFIIDEYQIVQAKSTGADVILLIAGILSPTEIARLGAFAHSLGLEVLLEVHNKAELDRSLSQHIDIVGVNNRDLTNFEVSVNTSFELAAHIPDSFIKVSESGLSDVETINQLKEAGYLGFLIGETFMKTSRPEKACAQLISKLKA